MTLWQIMLDQSVAPNNIFKTSVSKQDRVGDLTPYLTMLYRTIPQYSEELLRGLRQYYCARGTGKVAFAGVTFKLCK